MSARDVRRALLLAALFAGPAALPAADVEIARFSSAPEGVEVPPGWAPLAFRNVPRHTTYRTVTEDGTVVVRADADSAASGLVFKLTADAKSRPVLRWRWKVADVVARSDPSRKSGDDYAARIYVTFERPPGETPFLERAARAIYGRDLPHSGINYIWATTGTVDSVLSNAYTDRLRMIVVESGTSKAGRWVEEERDVYADYRKAFGTDPPPISGIAIMTDTDNTGSRATAWYGDVSLRANAAR